jgi:hypothetical protein
VVAVQHIAEEGGAAGSAEEEIDIAVYYSGTE